MSEAEGERAVGGAGPDVVTGWLRELADTSPEQVAGMEDAGLVDLLRVLEELKGASEGLQAVAAVVLDRSVRAEEERRGLPGSRCGRGVAGQVALARRESHARGRRHLGLASVLTREMPATLAALRAGRISEWRATLVARETACLSTEDRGLIDAELAGDQARLEAMGDAETAAAARRRAVQLDAAAMVKRRARAESERRVSLRPAPDTMSVLSVLLPVKDGAAVFATLDRQADVLIAAGDGRCRDQIRTDTLVDRVLGRSGPVVGSLAGVPATAMTWAAAPTGSGSTADRGASRATPGAGSPGAGSLGADLLGADLLGADLLGAELPGAGAGVAATTVAAGHRSRPSPGAGSAAPSYGAGSPGAGSPGAPPSGAGALEAGSTGGSSAGDPSPGGSCHAVVAGLLGLGTVESFSPDAAVSVPAGGGSGVGPPAGAPPPAREAGAGLHPSRRAPSDRQDLSSKQAPSGAAPPGPVTAASVSAAASSENESPTGGTRLIDLEQVGGGGSAPPSSTWLAEQTPAEAEAGAATGPLAEPSAVAVSGLSVLLHVVVSDRVLLGLSDEAAHLDGYGPIPAELVRELSAEQAWVRRLYARPGSGELVAADSRARRFPARLAQLVRLRDQRCRTPWCDAPVRHIDHPRAVELGGVTSLANGQGLCEACNHAKQAPGWAAGSAPGARHTVRTVTPTGHVYTSTAPRLAPSVGLGNRETSATTAVLGSV